MLPPPPPIDPPAVIVADALVKLQPPPRLPDRLVTPRDWDRDMNPDSWRRGGGS
jgi:hypothetical protein